MRQIEEAFWQFNWDCPFLEHRVISIVSASPAADIYQLNCVAIDPTRKVNMFDPQLRRLFIANLSALALAAILVSPASAIVIHDPVGVSGAIDLGTPHKSVVSLFVPGGFCSGTLIDSTHILTAKHCTAGAAPGSMSVQFYLDNDGVADATYGVTAKAEVPGGTLLDGTDISVLTLNAPAPAGVTPLRIGFGSAVGLTAETVGFGFSGIGSTGTTIGFDGKRKAAENVIDWYGAAIGGVGGANIFNTDFDSGSSNTLSSVGSSPTPLAHEGTTAGGDSGGPLLIDGKVFGVLSSGSTSGSGYGDISWWTDAGAQFSFIKAAAPDAKFGVVPTVASDASFSDSANLDVLNIDFGTLDVDDVIAPVSFDVANFPTGLTVSYLDLLSTTGSGDTGVLTTDLEPFVNMESGALTSFNAMIDTSAPGTFSASYDLNLSDFLGTDQTLTLNLSGIVEATLTCAIGDADCDGDVDVSDDILVAFSNFSGPGSFGLTRAHGDVEGNPDGNTPTTPGPADGDVDVSDILTMFGNFTGPLDEAGLEVLGALAGPAEAGDPSIPDLIYDPATGEVVLSTDGASIIGYSLKSAGAFLAGGHTPILGGVSTSLPTELAEAALSSADGSIGFVFPVGLDLAALAGLLTENTVSTGLGAPLVPFDLVVLGPAVPEPSAFFVALSALGALLAVAYRKLQRREE